MYISILAASWKVFVTFLQFSTHKNTFLAQFWTLLYIYFVKFGCKNCISNNYLMQNMHTIRNKLSSILLITIITQQILHLIHLKWVFKRFPYIYSVNWKVAFSIKDANWREQDKKIHKSNSRYCKVHHFKHFDVSYMGIHQL